MFDISAILVIFLTIDLFFFGITLYTVAMYEELEHMVKGIGSASVSDRISSMVRCINFHNEILV